MIRLLAVTLVVALVTVASLARADGAVPSTILLVIDPADASTRARLRGELEAFGFRTVEQPIAGAPDRKSLEEATKAVGAVAAIRISRSPSGVEVWVNDRVTGKSTLREVLAPEGGDAALVAVRAVELLRASLLELAEHPPRGDVPPDDTVRALAYTPAASPARWFVGLHAGLHVSAGGLDPSPLVAAGVSFRLHDYLALDLELVAPVLAAEITAREGTATSLVSLASVGGRAYVAPPASALNFYGGPGIGLMWMHLEGIARAPYVGVADDVLAPAIFFNTGAHVAASHRVRFVVEADVVITLTHPPIRFAGREVARWGRPALVSTLGIEVGLD
jgi:hypothetical protein